jgi:hypothetical protein
MQKSRQSGFQKGRVKTGGRKKGVPNKFTGNLNEAILVAANSAGSKEGLVGYFKKMAIENPALFLRFVGKLLPRPRRSRIQR